jgi:hypothetical protein
MVTFNVDSLDFVDDEEARFGADTDFATRFDSANSRLELEDLTNATVGYVPQDVGTDLVGGKFAETVAEGKALADDGNVYDTIQEAENNASSWVKVGPGDFRESVTIDTAGLTLQGSGERTIISSPSDGISVAASNLLIQNLSIKTDTGSSGNGIYANTTQNDVTIVSVHILSTGGSGIRNSDGSGTVTPSNWTIVNCEIEDSGVNGVRRYGEGDIVANCTIKNTANHGIQNREPGDDYVVVGNIVDTTDAADCIWTEGDDGLIGFNRCLNAFEDGIQTDSDATDTLIFNNRVTGSRGGITDQGTGTVLDANLIT